MKSVKQIFFLGLITLLFSNVVAVSNSYAELRNYLGVNYLVSNYDEKTGIIELEDEDGNTFKVSRCKRRDLI